MGVYIHVHALGVLCCFALLASFFLPSHLSFKNMYIHMGARETMYIHLGEGLALHYRNEGHMCSQFFKGIFKCMYSTRDCVKVSQPAMLSNVHVGVHGNRLPQLFLAAPQSSSGGG